MKHLLVLLLLSITIITTPSVTFAQSTMETQSGITSDGHTAREEQEGKEIWEKLQDKQITCDKLSDEEFGALGEYFMGQMVGDSHEAMNTMIERMMGKEGEEQMHAVMGKRLSSCDTSAQLPQSGVGFMPMMWMMGSAGSPQVGGGGNSMMGYGWNNMMGGWGLFGAVGLLFWIVLFIDLVLLGMWLWRQLQKGK